MKEIRIVLNNNQETFHGNEFSVYIDGTKLENVNEFNLKAIKPNQNEYKFIVLDNIISYTVNYSAPYFEND